MSSSINKQHQHLGSMLKGFLKEEGPSENARAITINDTIAYQTQCAIEDDSVRKRVSSKK